MRKREPFLFFVRQVEIFIFLLKILYFFKNFKVTLLIKNFLIEKTETIDAI